MNTDATTTPTPEAIAAAIELLAGNQDYEVFQRLPDQVQLTAMPTDGRQLFKGLLLDTETTGLDQDKDVVFQIAYILFTFCQEGKVYAVHDIYSGFQDPCVSLEPKIVQVTGFTDADLAGQVWDQGRIEGAFDAADLCIAHKADFDRVMCEKTFPSISGKAWACTLSQIPWDAEFHTGSAKLEYLLLKLLRTFYKSHDASVDVLATLYLITQVKNAEGKSVMAMMLEKSSEVVLRVYARGAIFERKDQLKEKGYKWFEGNAGMQKAWFKDIPVDAKLISELYLLWDTGYDLATGAKVCMYKVEATNRFRPHAKDADSNVQRMPLKSLIDGSIKRLQDMGVEFEVPEALAGHFLIVNAPEQTQQPVLQEESPAPQESVEVQEHTARMDGDSGQQTLC